MKKLFTLLLVISLFSVAANGQILKKLKDKIKDKTNQRVDDKTDQTIDKGLDKTEDATKKKDTTEKIGSQNTNSISSTSDISSSQALKIYSNYDFVAGDKVIFQSQLTDEQTGEIPSQFTLSNGQMDIQTEDGENVIHIVKGPGATFSPRMTTTQYLPDQFTVEFDAKNERFGTAHIAIKFGQGSNIIQDLHFGDGGGIDWTTGDVDNPEGLNTDADHGNTWHHIAIAINKNQGKVYIDQFRIVNVNNISGKAEAVIFEVNGYENSFIKNIRVAAGGIDIYKKIATDGKIVTHGILFDVDKSTIRAESMGTINSIYNLLKKDPSLKFEIDGHTDNTGNAAHNLTLSQQRADAVKIQLVSMGIDDSRLTTKGFGDTKPIDTNDTPEGKANNRRVEFVKM